MISFNLSSCATYVSMLLVLCMTPIISSSSSLCLISSTIHDNNNMSADIFFTYPIDIYGPILHPSLSTQNISNGLDGNQETAYTSYTCSNPEGKTTKSEHTCTTKVVCPLRKKYIKKANIIDGKDCVRLKDDVVHIFILGGSATVGTNAGGCCCSSEIDPACSSTADKKCRWNGDYIASSCGWVGYLTKYLETLDTKYEIINLAASGHRSKVMVDKAIDFFTQRQEPIYNHDIFLLDHSVNDAIDGINDQDKEEDFSAGVELLLRTILKYAHRGWPHIVLLEMFPFPNKFHISSYDINTYEEFDYSKHYRTLGRYYNISVWSLKEVIWTLQESRDDVSNILEYLRFDNTFVYNRHYERVHPPWHVHLFYADLVAYLFHDKFEAKCIMTSTPQILKNHLPPPLNALRHSVCDSSIEKFFYFDFTEPIFFPLFDYEIIPFNSWTHTEDRPGKYGLISTFAEDVNRHAVKIPLNITLLENMDPNQEVVLFFTFLRTYLNAGALEIDVCGQWIVIVDALWRFYQTNIISVPEVFKFRLLVKDILKHCANDPVPYMLFEHYKHKSVSTEEDIARTPLQKFRMDKIVLCVPEELEAEWIDQL